MLRYLLSVIVLRGACCLAAFSASMPALATPRDDDDARPRVMVGRSAPARANKDKAIDSDSLFGFTEGSDTGEAGERELSYQIIRRRRVGRNAYNAADNAFKLEYALRDDLKLGIGASLDAYRIAQPRPSGRVNGDDRDKGGTGPRPPLGDSLLVLHRQATESEEDETSSSQLPRHSIVQSLSGELKYRILERGEMSPVGLAVSLEPEYRRVISGRGFDTSLLQFQTKFMADTALVPEHLFLATNLSWEPQVTRTHEGTTVRDTNVEASFALTARVSERMFFGGEVRYLASFEGLALREAPDYGIFVGPTLYARLSDQAYVASAWLARVGGVIRKQPEPIPDFGNVPDPAERYHLRLQFGYSF